MPGRIPIIGSGPPAGADQADEAVSIELIDRARAISAALKVANVPSDLLTATALASMAAGITAKKYGALLRSVTFPG